MAELQRYSFFSRIKANDVQATNLSVVWPPKGSKGTIMPIQVSRYLCQHCKQEYKDYQRAMECEMLPIPPNPYPEGSTISFQNEETLFGSRYSYGSASGEVLYACLATKNDQNYRSHVWVWVVKVNGGSMFPECLVLEGKDDFGNQCLMSPAEDKHPSGFADALRLKHQNPY